MNAMYGKWDANPGGLKPGCRNRPPASAISLPRSELLNFESACRPAPCLLLVGLDNHGGRATAIEDCRQEQKD
jgi:hypothetical protein